MLLPEEHFTAVHIRGYAHQGGPGVRFPAARISFQVVAPVPQAEAVKRELVVARHPPMLD